MAVLYPGAAAGTRPARDVWMAEGLDPAPVLREISELAKRRRVPLRYVGRRQLDLSAWLIEALERVGLAWDVVRVPPEKQVARHLATAAGARPN